MPSKNIDMMVDALVVLRSSAVSATLDVVRSPDRGDISHDPYREPGCGSIEHGLIEIPRHTSINEKIVAKRSFGRSA